MRTGQGTSTAPPSIPAPSALAAALAASFRPGVDAAALRPARRSGIVPERVARQRRAVAHWLLALAGLVLAMVVLGGITRLHHAGLSIVDWRPLVGVLPPFGEEAWQALFADYQRFPEYQEINRGMTLGSSRESSGLNTRTGFSGASSASLSRCPSSGSCSGAPSTGRWVSRCWPSASSAGSRGCSAGTWCQSGLVDRPDVSPYRLAAHLDSPWRSTAASSGWRSGS